MTSPRTPRRFRPCLEALDARELPSSLPVLHAGSRAAVSRVPDASGQTASTPPWVNQSLLEGLAAQLYAPLVTTTSIQVGSEIFPPGTYSVPQPTPAEIRRQTFWVEF